MRRRVLVLILSAAGLSAAGCGDSAKVEVPAKTAPPPKEKPMER